MNPFDWIMTVIGVVIVLWYVGWFGTNHGERVINRFTEERWKIFVIFNVSLIIAFALIFIYFVHRAGVLS